MARVVDQKRLLSEMWMLAKQKQQQERATVRVVGQLDRFAHNRRSVANPFESDNMLSPEEFMRTIVLLRHLSKKQLHRFLVAGLKMLAATQANVETQTPIQPRIAKDDSPSPPSEDLPQTPPSSLFPGVHPLRNFRFHLISRTRMWG